MIRLTLKDNTLYWRPQCRALTVYGVRYGYLVTELHRRLFGKSKEVYYIQDVITGRCSRVLDSHSIAVFTGLVDKHDKPICCGDEVSRWDSITKKEVRGFICYNYDIAAFIFKTYKANYPRTSPLLQEETVCSDNHEYKIQYTYTKL